MSIAKEEWAILISAGIPITSSEEPTTFDGFDALPHLLLKILDHQCEPKVRDAIRGWLIALSAHYPTIFQRYFHNKRFRALIAPPIDGRDIKLRRIALAHLGKIA